MKKNLFLFIALISTLLSGCTHNRHRTAEATAYVNAQKEMAVARKPLFELRAQPGQTITLSGVESLVVNDPREQRIDALPVQRNELLPTVLGLAKLGAQIYMGEQNKDMWLGITQAIGANAGDHSNTTTSITGSFNTRGDEIVDSNLISGGVSGDGAGIGNALTRSETNTSLSGNGSALGNDNTIDNQAVGGDRITGDRNQNSGRQDSGGPYDNDVDCQTGNAGNGGTGGNSGTTGAGGTGGNGLPSGGANCNGGG